MTDKFYRRLTEIRRHIHQHPELSGEERETSRYIQRLLEEWGVSVRPSSLETGVIAEVGNRGRGPVVALRADIDALPIGEKTGLSYASVRPGVMHACGHDFHQAALLGAAYELKRREAELPGLARLIFQPGEEATWGSRQVIAAGHLEDVRVILGFHNHPAYPPGTVALREGAIMAGVDQFRVKVWGKGSHAAQPHLGTDVILAMTAAIQQLQTIVSRNIDPRESAVLSVTRIRAGDSWNALPDEGEFQGTARSFSEETRALLRDRFFTVVKAAEAAMGVKAEIDWRRGPDVTVSDPGFTAELARCCARFARVIPAEPSGGGEDFSSYLGYVPGVFAFVGSNGEAGAPGWHHSDFTVKDEALPTAVDYYTEGALHLLKVLKASDAAASGEERGNSQ